MQQYAINLMILGIFCYLLKLIVNTHKSDDFIGVPDSLYLQMPELEQARLDKEVKLYTGFIAQEVEEAANACGFDFSGIIKPESEKSQYSLSYAEFVVPLVKALQEQQAICISISINYKVSDIVLPTG